MPFACTTLRPDELRMRSSPQRPIPVPTPLTQPFWDAAKDGRLAIQRCRGCRRYFHPPVTVCTRCYGTDLGFEPVSGHGHIYSRTIMHDPRMRGFEEAVPFAIIIVELVEQRGLFLVSNLPGASIEDVEIGAEVQVMFEPMAAGFVLPQFRRSGRS